MNDVMIHCRICGYEEYIPKEWAIRNPSGEYHCRGLVRPTRARCPVRISCTELAARMQRQEEIEIGEESENLL